MRRLVFAWTAIVLVVASPAQANAQAARHNFSGLCAYYPAHGNGLTAAHPTLPFGTRVRVTDPKTGRSVTVTVNDRGPFGRHRVLDLSPSAARARNDQPRRHFCSSRGVVRARRITLRSSWPDLFRPSTSLS